MIHIATEADREALLKYLAEDIASCLYLYLDIYHYGLDSSAITVWYSPNEDGYSFIAMRYSDSLQVYSRTSDFDVSELAQLVRETRASRIFGPKRCIEVIEPLFADDHISEYGVVIEKVKGRDFGDMFDVVEKASPEDLPEIARLLLMDPDNAQAYTYDQMLSTLTGLLDSGMGSCYFIRFNDTIVATESISAESDLFLVSAYLITHPDYRRNIYGTLVESYVYERARGSKRLFTFVVDPRRKRMLTAQGNPVVTEYGKLIKVKENEYHG